jgi:hypothetical protein
MGGLFFLSHSLVCNPSGESIGAVGEVKEEQTRFKKDLFYENNRFSQNQRTCASKRCRIQFLKLQTL